jgi:diguanylate cyclase (GGDEF)-like protein/PAS domain S-box-containing protein
MHYSGSLPSISSLTVYEGSSGGIQPESSYYVLIAVAVLLLVFAAIQLYISKLKKRLHNQQILSKSIVENAKTMMIICSSDGKVIIFNKYAHEVTGYSPEEIEGSYVGNIPLLNEGTGLGEMILETMRSKTVMHNYDACLTAKDGRKVYTLWNIDVVNSAENSLKYTAALGMDITDRKNAESKLAESYQELESLYDELVTKEIELRVQFDDLNSRENDLRRSEERYRLAVEGVNDGIWDWDGKDGRLFLSRQSKAILGLQQTDEYLTIEKWFDVIAKEDLDMFIRSLNKYITQPQKHHFQIEYRIRTENDTVKWIRTRGKAIWDESGIPVRMAGSITDITEQRRTDEKVHRLAYYDSLTGLPNRALLSDRFIVAAANAGRKGKKVAVYFLDLDNFKTINDTIGHTYGDQLLLKVGEQLMLKMRRSDTLARLGGDEFIILQSNVGCMDDVYRLAVRLLDIFKKPWALNDREFYVTASIGISVYPDDGSDLQELMKNADAAMYRAKENGKNNFQVFTQELNLRIMKRMEIENHLRKAAERNEFVLYYQPQIDLKTGRVRSVEALIRWPNPEMGWTMPDAFIHIAEETGLISDIGDWVLCAACTQLKKWHQEGHDDLKVSVNLSARQFQMPGIYERIIDIIQRTGIEAEWLELEITESLAMQDLEMTIDILGRFRKAGIGISLDDFGKGYSSLNYLKALPITNLKIDKSFIRGISSGSNQSKIVKALISLAHSMDLSVTAEGVENRSQLEYLVRECCDNAQGYLFSRPKTAKDIDISSYGSSLEMIS